MITSAVRFRVQGPAGEAPREVELRGEASLGSARSADLVLTAGELPKVVAVLATVPGGIELRCNDHPQGGIANADGRIVPVLSLHTGTRFSLPPYDFTVLTTTAATTVMLPPAAGAGPSPRTRRHRVLLFWLKLVSVIIPSVVVTVLVLSLLRPRPSSIAQTQPQPATMAENTTTPLPPPRHSSDPAIVNWCIVLPRPGLDDAGAARVQALAQELLASLTDDPSHLRCQVLLAGSGWLTIDGTGDYRALRGILAARRDELTDLLPALPAAGATSELAGLLPGPELPPAPWPLVWRLGRSGGGTVAIAEMERIELIDTDGWNTTIAEFFPSTDQKLPDLATAYTSGDFLYCFTYAR